MKDKILVVAVHPDDETLGCGGTLLKHRANGDEIHWMLVTSVLENQGFSADDVLLREKQIQAVGRAYRFSGIHRLDIPTTKVDEISISQLVEKIAAVIKSVKPTVVYLPFFADVHSDHKRIFEAAFSCTKSFRYPFIRRVLMMETISETEFAPSVGSNAFVPNVIVDVSKFMDQKVKIMKLYKTEIKDRPFPRSIDNITALGTFRGGMGGCKYAESFMLLKEIG
ncbi:MAG: PIG-L family deacetylase [Candidatus Omnitrophica bacterium]|nr:PIG-L family deacetylase [Candidatus Omnitrophota bacterium]